MIQLSFYNFLRSFLTATAAATQPTTPPATAKPTKGATSKAPETDQDADQRSKIYRNNDGYGQTVEKSNNNTLKMNGKKS